jgi:asparagine synthase (glutamine-hydrolysing)
MCGLAAIIGLDGFRPERWRLEAMAEAIRHRGPDDQGYYESGSVGFGYRRLSILDLTAAGHQPMLSHDGRYAIIFNGEIYNYVELREELAARGHRFRSTGDSEVLLTAFAEWGEACLPKLNGMWAFLIHDRNTGALFGARDRFGVKPLYYCRTKEALLFASELKAFAPSGLYQPAVNWRTAGKFLHTGVMDDGVETFYAGIEHIPAGSCFAIDPLGQLKIWSYWAFPLEEEAAPPDAAERFANLFEDSVRLRLRSDVPVGVCLSGGLDSTAIICAMARQRTGPAREQPLFAFSYNAAEFDETPYLEATIRQTGATLVNLSLSGREFWETFAAVLAAQDEPVHTMTAVVGYGLMKLAHDHGVTVILNGQGSDETAAGYPTFFLHYWHTLLRSHRYPSAAREINRFAEVHGRSRGEATLSLLRHALLWRLGSLAAYRRFVETGRRRRYAEHPLFTGELTGHLSVERPEYPGTLREALVEAVTHDPLPLYLRVEDRNSMAHSVEARLPFLDYRLVSFLFTLPPDQKTRGPWNKYILRESMRGRIPEVVRARAQKFGFPVPVKQWITDGLYEPLRDLLGGRAARARGIYRTERVLGELERARKGEGELATPLIRMAQFELWSELLQSRSAPALAPS